MDVIKHLEHIEHLLPDSSEQMDEVSYKNHLGYLIQVLVRYDQLHETTVDIASQHQEALAIIAEQKNQIEVLTASLNQKAYTASVKQRTMAGRLNESQDNND